MPAESQEVFSEVSKTGQVRELEMEEAVSEWRPIETAPKDGNWILGYRPPPNSGGEWETLVVIRWHEEDGVRDFIWPDSFAGIVDPFVAPCADDAWLFDGNFYESRGTFTHWMPLPEPPK